MRLLHSSTGGHPKISTWAGLYTSAYPLLSDCGDISLQFPTRACDNSLCFVNTMPHNELVRDFLQTPRTHNGLSERIVTRHKLNFSSPPSGVLDTPTSAWGVILVPAPLLSQLFLTHDSVHILNFPPVSPLVPSSCPSSFPFPFLIPFLHSPSPSHFST